MVRTYLRRTLLNYTREHLDEALNKILRNQLSVYDASKQYSIPMVTLYKQLARNHRLNNNTKMPIVKQSSTIPIHTIDAASMEQKLPPSQLEYQEDGSIRIVKQNLEMPIRIIDETFMNSKQTFRKHGELFPTNIRAIFAGPSNCGKTSALLSLFFCENGVKFLHLCVYSKSLYQRNYEFLRQVMEQLKSDGVEYREFNENDEVLAVDEVKPHTVMIFDDIPIQDQSKIMEYFSMGRHKDIDSFYLCQTYASALKHRLRDNANVIALWKQDDTNLKHVYADHVNTDMSYDKFKELCALCWNGVNSKYNLLLIVKDMDINNGRYRRNFDEYIYI